MWGSTVNTKISVIALIAIGVIARVVDAKRSRRIFEGEYSEVNEFPCLARLILTDGNGTIFECCGAIISPRHILTVASCLEGVTVNEIWTGVDIRDYNLAVRSRLAKVILNRKSGFRLECDWVITKDDIGIVVLSEDLKENGNQKVISLTDKETTVETHALLSGWGSPNEFMKLNAMLIRKTRITILPSDKCPTMTAKQLCGGSIPKATPTSDDRGCPLVVGDHLVGLLLTSCGIPGRESIYADVYHYRDWIESTVHHPLSTVHYLLSNPQ